MLDGLQVQVGAVPGREGQGEEWFSLVAAAASTPLSQVGYRGPGGSPVQRPEVVVVHTSRVPRPEDHLDSRR